MLKGAAGRAIVKYTNILARSGHENIAIAMQRRPLRQRSLRDRILPERLAKEQELESELKFGQGNVNFRIGETDFNDECVQN
ncbi:MAG: hypothetical protein SW833_22120 [Cyanobacteriota bacterium]|nr:hypothetical protein [Cyanobacteriota bacterium]